MPRRSQRKCKRRFDFVDKESGFLLEPETFRSQRASLAPFLVAIVIGINDSLLALNLACWLKSDEMMSKSAT
jgi:hypothetical protein